MVHGTWFSPTQFTSFIAAGGSDRTFIWYKQNRFVLEVFLWLLQLSKQQFLPPNQHCATHVSFTIISLYESITISFRSSPTESIHLFLGLLRTPRSLSFQVWFPFHFSRFDYIVLHSSHNASCKPLQFFDRAGRHWCYTDHIVQSSLCCTFFSSYPLLYRIWGHIFFPRSYFKKFSTFIRFVRSSSMLHSRMLVNVGLVIVRIRTLYVLPWSFLREGFF